MQRKYLTGRSFLSALTLTAATLSLLTPGAFAQDDKEKAEKDKQDRLQVSAVYVGDEIPIVRRADNSYLQKKVSLEAENMPIVEAIKRVAEQGGIACEIDADVPTDKTITVTMKNVPLSIVLGYLTQEAGIGWSYYQKGEGDKIDRSLKIGRNRRRGSFTLVTPTAPASPRPPAGIYYDNYKTQAQVAEAMKAATEAARMAQTHSFSLIAPSRLPDTRVKLDVRGTNIREVLKDVLKQANLNYVLEDDVPDDVKRSFTFENVPVGTALDVICRSAEIGWSVEGGNRGRLAVIAAPAADKEKEAAKEKEEKKAILIRIGKKYARRWTNLYGASAGDVFGANTSFAEARGYDAYNPFFETPFFDNYEPFEAIDPVIATPITPFFPPQVSDDCAWITDDAGV